MAKKKKNTGGATSANGGRSASQGIKRKCATPKKKTRRQIEEENAKKAKRVKLFLLIFAIVGIVGVIGGVVGGLIYNSIISRTIDYENDDLGQYIYISPDIYKNIPVTVKLDPVDDLAVDDALIKALCLHRELEGDGKYYTEINRPLGVGDSVYVFYRGYLIEDGKRVYFDGGCNFDSYKDISSDGSLITIGSSNGTGEMIPGFALGLIGKNPKDYDKLSVMTSGTVKEGDIISFTYSTIMPDSKVETNVTKIVEVRADVCDAIYGTGFAEFLIGKEVGEIPSDAPFTAQLTASGTTAYTDMKINRIYNSGENSMTVMTRFPIAYSEEKLAGKIAYFDVYVEKMQLYKVPVIDEEYITEKVGITMEELDSYAEEGSTTLYDKYRDYIRAGLVASQKITIDNATETEMWEWYYKNTTVKWLPEGEVFEYYNDYVTEAETKWQNAQSSGTAQGTIDSYVCTQYGLEDGTDWRAYFRETAERNVTDKIIFYYVARAENLLPNEEEYKKVYDELVEEYLSIYLERAGCVRENYDSDEEYNAAVANARRDMVAYYGDDYLRENTIFLHAMTKITAYANVTDSRPEPVTPDIYTKLIL